jgi:ABC-2 type transport system ATP-binding protein
MLLEMTDVRVHYGAVEALKGISFTVEEGEIVALLGANGAGKTTTIRCLLGLVAPSRGRLRLLGSEVPGHLPAAIRRVGSIVEAPALFPRFSGRRNLEILGRIDGIGRSAIDASLERVGLTERAGDMVKTYSLGMKQRLGIAAALLKDPAVLVLDEPANGLDPAGIVDVRGLLRSLGAEGRTVFVSSHILSEIQQTADRVAIIARGRLVTSGPVSEVLAARGGGGLVVKLADLQAGFEVLTAAGLEVSMAPDALRVSLPESQAERVSRTLAEHGLFVTELRPDEVDLETVFLELTGGDRGAAP